MNHITHAFQGRSEQNVWNVLKGNPLHQSISSNKIVWVVASLALFAFASFAGCLAAYFFGSRKPSRIKGAPIMPPGQNVDVKKLIVPSEFINHSKASELTPPLSTIATNEKFKLSSHKSLDTDWPASLLKKEDMKEVVDLTASHLSPVLDNTLPKKGSINLGPCALYPTGKNENEILKENSDNPQNLPSSNSSSSNTSATKVDDNIINIKLEDKRTPAWMNDHSDVSFTELKLTTYDEILDFLRKHGSQLNSINLGSFSCTNDEFEAFIKLCPNINHFFVFSGNLTDKALEHLKGMPLTSVNFSGCWNLTGIGLGALKGMLLTSVDFSGCEDLTDNALEHLKGMPLTSVNFNGCDEFTDKALEHLKGMPLTSVDFSSCYWLTDKAFEHFKGMQLTNVNFSDCDKLTDKALEYLNGMPLIHVNFNRCYQLTDKGLEYLKGMPLTSVMFSCCENLTDKALENLKGMPLTRVTFSGCDKLTDNALEHLKGMPLTSVNFRCCEKLTDKTFEHFKGMRLTNIYFSDCKKLTDKALEHLKGMPVKIFHFDGCDEITDNALEDLRLSCGMGAFKCAG